MLAVGDNELNVGDNDDALLRLAGSRLPRVLGIARAQVPRMFIFVFVIAIFVFYSKKQIQGYIICYNKYGIKVATSVLAVGDNELDVGDDNDASLETAEGLAHAGGLREITWLIHCRAACQECLCLYLLLPYLYSTQKNKSNDI